MDVKLVDLDLTLSMTLTLTLTLNLTLTRSMAVTLAKPHAQGQGQGQVLTPGPDAGPDSVVWGSDVSLVRGHLPGKSRLWVQGYLAHKK